MIKKFKMLVGTLLLVGCSIIILTGCSSNSENGLSEWQTQTSDDALLNMSQAEYNEILLGEKYLEIVENDYVKSSENAESYFTLDSNTSSYSNLRRYIDKNIMLDKNVIKTDELINYFKYDLPEPTGSDAFSIRTKLLSCPWNEEHALVSIGVASKKVALSPNVRNNLVFLIDVSGSMSGEINLIKESFPLMLDSLNPDDTISIVTYAASSKIVLQGVKVSDKGKIVEAINGLKTGSTTFGSKGINDAYEIAEQYFITGGNNRIILATDGDFNVGTVSLEGLKDLISQKRETGIYLSVLGMGMGNYNDSTAQTLAMNGNGNYAYIDTLMEAKKVLTEDLTTTLIAVAKDVKIKVEFNPDVVEEYRLLGYENKIITKEDFENSEKDASEVGSGHTTMAVYEIVLKNNEQNTLNLCTTTINYKDPKNDEDKTINCVYNIDDISNYFTNLQLTEDDVFVSCLIEFSLILRDSQYKGNANFASLLNRVERLESVKTDPYRAEFLELIKKAYNNSLVGAN